MVYASFSFAQKSARKKQSDICDMQNKRENGTVASFEEDQRQNKHEYRHCGTYDSRR